jgi:transposase-like protein
VYRVVFCRDDVGMVDVELSGVVGAVSRRRRRSAEERRRVVEETLVVGASVARVAGRHGVNANQVFQWRRLYQSGLLGGTPTNALKLLPVSVTEDAVPVEPEQVEGMRLSKPSCCLL